MTEAAAVTQAQPTATQDTMTGATGTQTTVTGGRTGPEGAVQASPVAVGLAHLAAGCNGVPHAASWGPSGLVAYGAHHSVIVCDPQAARNLLSLPGHSSRVSCVEWLPQHDVTLPGVPRPPEDILLSGCGGGTLMLWSYNRTSGKWTHQQSIPGAHKKAISCITATLLPSSPFPSADGDSGGQSAEGGDSAVRGSALAATASADGTVGIWAVHWHTAGTPSGVAHRQQPEGFRFRCTASLVQSLPIGPRVAEAVALSTPLGGASPLGRAPVPSQGHTPSAPQATVAQGHTNWSARGRQGQHVLLAVGGLDSHIQLYCWDIPDVSSRGDVSSGGDASNRGDTNGGGVRGEVSTSAGVQAATPAPEPCRFVAVCQLRGHQDWIRSLSFSFPVVPGTPSAHQSDLSLSTVPVLLASGSQDKTIRVWRIAPQAGGERAERAEGVGVYGGASGGDSFSGEALGGVLGEASDGILGGELEGMLGLGLGDASVQGVMGALGLEAYTVGPSFMAQGVMWTAQLDSLLLGHEDWVHSVRWHPPICPEPPSTQEIGAGGGALRHTGADGGDRERGIGGERGGWGERGDGFLWTQPLRLLSASMDRTLLTWRHDVASGLWLNDASLGELAHSALGFFGGLWSPAVTRGVPAGAGALTAGGRAVPAGAALLAHGFAGTFHYWVRSDGAGSEADVAGDDMAGEGASSAPTEWVSRPFVTGHFGAVVDVCWDAQGKVLLSASHDQTARATVLWETAPETSAESTSGAPTAAKRSAAQGGAKEGVDRDSHIPAQPPTDVQNGAHSDSSNDAHSGAGRTTHGDSPSDTHGATFSDAHSDTGGATRCEGGTSPGVVGGWRETARPQVHGHDLQCCAFLPSHSIVPNHSIMPSHRIVPSHSIVGEGAERLGVEDERVAQGHASLAEGRARLAEEGASLAEEGASLAGEGASLAEEGASLAEERELVYASGAEEKVVRLFASPRTFLESLAHASHKSHGPGASYKSHGPSASHQSHGHSHAVGASMPALGLSQTPIYASADGSSQQAAFDAEDEGGGLLGGEYSDAPPPAHPLVLDEPPLESHLQHSTLWPEIRKLYGHGNEVVCCAADHSGRLLATACKAQSLEFADVWLWDCATWRAHMRLRAHTLTVTQMEFSAADRYLLCVSRDRHVSVFQRSQSVGDALPSYSLMWRGEGHKRIIWACSWAPMWGGETVFATGARDKGVKLWAADPGTERAEPAAVGEEGAGGATEHTEKHTPGHTEQSTPGSSVEPLASLTQWPQAVTALAWSPFLTPQERSTAAGVPPTSTNSTNSTNGTANSADGTAGGALGASGRGVPVGESSILAVGMEGGEIELWAVTLSAPAPNIVTGTGADTMTGTGERGGVGESGGGAAKGKGRHLEVVYKEGKGGGEFGVPGKVQVQVQRIAKLDRTFCHVATVHRLRWNCIRQGESGDLYVQYCTAQAQDEDCVGVQHKAQHELVARQGGTRSRGSRQLVLASCGADHALRIFYVYL